MDSYYFYTENCLMGDDKIKNCKALVQHICDELFSPPYSLKNSVFMAKASQMLKGTPSKSISECDAYIVLLALQGYMAGNEKAVDYMLSQYVHFLFNGSIFPYSQRRQFYEKTQSMIRATEQIVIDEKKAYESREAKRAEEEALRKEITIQIPRENTSAELEREKALTERLRMRMAHNKEMAHLWHKEQAETQRQLIMMQPDIKKLLEGFMSYSSTVTEEYVLRYGKMLIELYNQLADGYDYHSPVAKMSDNSDYRNAVSNYEEYMYTVSDSLAAFGIEEIVSAEGTPFDGKIHTQEGDFNPREAVVVKSVRSGFKYNDIILQREVVTVQ